MDNKNFTRRVFSGIQPSGGLHLGNYLGALKRFVSMQSRDYETIYCMVDLHAITVWQNPRELANSTRELCAGFIASGLDPYKSVLFNQSQVPEHAQLAWVFNTVARMGWLNRMTQFKDKAGKNRENVSIGLFAYPTLMAADILLYHATHVPVGEDQKQHLELTRDIASKFNHDYDVNFFPITEPVIEGTGTRVMSLRDGTKKMSKSDPSEFSRINLTDPPDLISLKIQKARTDSDGIPSESEGLLNRPEAANLVNIFSALADLSIEQTLNQFGGNNFSTFKKALAEMAVEQLSNISNDMSRLMKDPDEIDKILYQGANRAKKIATPILNKTYDIIGMVR
jgi:tryptophanyl-tRNA synthetase